MSKNKQDADKQRQEIEKINSQIKTLNNSYSQKLSALKEAIKNGKTTSLDHVMDFVTAYFGMWDEETTKPYKNLREQINQNIGKEVLVIKTETKEEEMFKHAIADHSGIMDNPKWYSSDIELQFGAISSRLELNVQTGGIIIPTKNYAIAKIQSVSDSNICFPENTLWEKVEGDIKNTHDKLSHLFSENTKRMLSSFSSYAMDYCSRLSSEIIIGDQVEQYFKKCPNGNKAYIDAKALLDPQSRGELF